MKYIHILHLYTYCFAMFYHLYLDIYALFYVVGKFQSKRNQLEKKQAKTIKKRTLMTQCRDIDNIAKIKNQISSVSATTLAIGCGTRKEIHCVILQ